MITTLDPIDDGVNLLDISDVTPFDFDNVSAWLFAIDMPVKDRIEAFRQLLTDGSFSVCNIEYRVEICCRT